jgi:hypothetical protein
VAGVAETVRVGEEGEVGMAREEGEALEEVVGMDRGVEDAAAPEEAGAAVRVVEAGELPETELEAGLDVELAKGVVLKEGAGRAAPVAGADAVAAGRMGVDEVGAADLTGSFPAAGVLL